MARVRVVGIDPASGRKVLLPLPALGRLVFRGRRRKTQAAYRRLQLRAEREGW